MITGDVKPAPEEKPAVRKPPREKPAPEEKPAVRKPPRERTLQDDLRDFGFRRNKPQE